MKCIVTVVRELVKEISVVVDVPDLNSFKEIDDEDVYSVIDAYAAHAAWIPIEDSIDVTLCPTKTNKSPLLVWNTNAKGEEDKLIKYIPPVVDSRQMTLPGTENKDA